MLSFNPFKSKTVWAAVIGAVGYLLQAPKIGVGEVVGAIGMVGTALGLKDAVNKS